MNPELFSVAGQRVAVTGASRGIGQAIALAFAHAGADVALLARSREPLEETAQAVRSLGRRALVLPTDVTEPSQLAASFARIQAELGGLDTLINNAGVNIRKPSMETTEEGWHTVLRTNLDSMFFASREAARLMLPEKRGQIVSIGSVAALVATPSGPAYSASKAGVTHLTRSLALEWSPHGIRVNCIAPWYFRTEMTAKNLANPSFYDAVLRATPLGRVGELPELVGVAIFLASRASAYITGQVLVVDGGMSIQGFRQDLSG